MTTPGQAAAVPDRNLDNGEAALRLIVRSRGAASMSPAHAAAVLAELARLRAGSPDTGQASETVAGLLAYSGTLLDLLGAWRTFSSGSTGWMQGDAFPPELEDALDRLNIAVLALPDTGQAREPDDNPMLSGLDLAEQQAHDVLERAHAQFRASDRAADLFDWQADALRSAGLLVVSSGDTVQAPDVAELERLRKVAEASRGVTRGE
jgi:hypothetical protein